MPYKIHTILTDNGIQFAEQPRNRNTASSRPMRFDMICAANDIDHRLTKPNHPWNNGQVERMNRTIKDATVKGVSRYSVTIADLSESWSRKADHMGRAIHNSGAADLLRKYRKAGLAHV